MMYKLHEIDETCIKIFCKSFFFINVFLILLRLTRKSRPFFNNQVKKW